MKKAKTMDDIQNELTQFGIEVVQELMEDQITIVGELCVDPKLAKMYNNVFEKMNAKVQEYL